MSYRLSDRQLRELILPVSKAAEALVRLDERIARSPLRQGFIERQHFADAVASLWVDGELVHLDDLVLHDGRMDARAPTHELTRASEVLRMRRHIAGQAAGWPLSPQGIAVLCGKESGVQEGHERTDRRVRQQETQSEGLAATDPLSIQLAEMDAVLARSTAALEKLGRSASSDLNPLVYEPDWDEDARLAAWQGTVADAEDLPGVLRAAVALDAWHDLRVLQRAPWIGRMLAASLLRQTGLSSVHLLAINVGLRAIPRERRHARTRFGRMLAILDGFIEAGEAGLREHDRLLLAKGQMERRLVGRQSNSKMPELIDLVLARPLVSAALIARELDITTQGALQLCRALNLREMTGRRRYRAWGVL